MMGRDLARMLDPGYWLSDAGIEKPDDWQTAAMRSPAKRALWNVHRQGGKSSTAALKAIATAVGTARAPILVLSPSQRQSQETVRTCLALHSKIMGLPPVIAESAHRLELANGSRILSLPSSETTVRGFSRVALLLLDEASRIPDDIVSACRPMLAVSDGTIVALSTPAGRRGFWFEWWENGGETWERTEVTVDQCPRISRQFLDEERKALGEALYQQEYLCRFVKNDEAMFPTHIIDAAFSPEVMPLWS